MIITKLTHSTKSLILEIVFLNPIGSPDTERWGNKRELHKIIFYDLFSYASEEVFYSFTT
jgi:hypothetical protein